MFCARQPADIEDERLGTAETVFSLYRFEIARTAVRREYLTVDSGTDQAALISQLPSHVLAEYDRRAPAEKLMFDAGGDNESGRPEAEQHEPPAYRQPAGHQKASSAVHLRRRREYLKKRSGVAASSDPEADGGIAAPDRVWPEIVQHCRDPFLRGVDAIPVLPVGPSRALAWMTDYLDPFMLHLRRFAGQKLKAEYPDFMATQDEFPPDIAQRIFDATDIWMRCRIC
jgi:hypothetical protein